MSSLQASKLYLYKQFDVVPILKSLNTPYSFTIQNLVLLSQSERLLQNLSLNHCTINQLYITNNTKHFSFKSVRAVRVVKLTKTDWLVVLQLQFQRNTTLYYF